jgi:acetyltransferase-like isoleucine patch superfamily enzyme
MRRLEIKVMIRLAFRLLIVLLPWWVRRRILIWTYGFELHPTARIGFSWIFPRHLVMAEGARIGHFNVAIHLERIEMAQHSVIDRSNWITGYPSAMAGHFAHLPTRDPALRMGAHSAITKRHHIDCTEYVEIGAFATIAGYGSQLMTHSIDLEQNRQDAAPIIIGEYCFVGTDVVVLGGSRLPPRSVLGAKALLNKPYEAPEMLYGGVPARPLKPLPPGQKYFSRVSGFVT